MSGIEGVLTMKIAACIALALPLIACGPVRTIREPVEVVVERRIYVGIPDCLTAKSPIPEGKPSQLPDVAAARRALIESLYARMDAIAAIQGTEVQPNGSPICSD